MCFSALFFILYVEEVIPETNAHTVDTTKDNQLTEPLQLSYNTLTDIPIKRSIHFFWDS